jgi:hypothetical protein
MYQVKSLRLQGAVVEITEKGLTRYKKLTGFDSCLSDTLTADMKFQADAKMIKVSNIRRLIRDIKPTAISLLPEIKRVVKEIEQPVEIPLAEIESIKEAPVKPMLESLLYANLVQMKKPDLAKLALKRGVDLSNDPTKAKIVDLLLKTNS